MGGHYSEADTDSHGNSDSFAFTNFDIVTDRFEFTDSVTVCDIRISDFQSKLAQLNRSARETKRVL